MYYQIEAVLWGNAGRFFRMKACEEGIDGEMMDKAWFDGPQDPKMELVEVRIDEAEYWNVKENKLLQLLKIGKAAATGTRPHLGEHKELHFNR